MTAAGGFDLSAMHPFWHIFESLRREAEPRDEEWEQLFRTPGYRALTAFEFRPDFFMQFFRLAFRPSLDTERRQMLRRDRYGFLLHYSEVATQPGEIRRQETVLKEQEEYWHEQAMIKCQEWLLPAGFGGRPQVAFVIFQDGFRAYSPLVYDVLSTTKLGQLFVHVLAHGYHRFYRTRLLQVDYHLARVEDRTLIYVLDQIQAHGIANLVDNPVLLARNHPWVTGFRDALRRVPAYIAELDAVLLQVVRGELDSATAGSRLQERLASVMDPVGFYMATAINQALGPKLLVATAANPFAFFALYQQAAERQRGLVALSPQSTAYLKQLGAAVALR